MQYDNSGDLFADIPSDLSEEIFTTLAQAEGLRIERIVSRGHASLPDFWYDQNENEWVVVLSGSAVVEFEGGETIDFRPGTYANIPAHVRHRVRATDENETTVWLAIHYRQAQADRA